METNEIIKLIRKDYNLSDKTEVYQIDMDKKTFVMNITDCWWIQKGCDQKILDELESKGVTQAKIGFGKYLLEEINNTNGN